MLWEVLEKVVTRMELVAISCFVGRELVFVYKTPDPMAWGGVLGY